MLYSNNCLTSDTLSLFATAHGCAGIDRSGSSTSVLQSVHGKVVSVDCSLSATQVLPNLHRPWWMDIQPHIVRHEALVQSIIRTKIRAIASINQFLF